MGDTDADALEITMTSGIRGLAPFAAPAAGRFVVAGALSAVAALLSLVPFWVIYRCVEEVVAGSGDRGELGGLAVLALVAIAVRFVVFGVSLAVSHVAAYQVLYGIRMGIAEHLTRVPLGYVTGRRSGELRKVMGDDVERLEQFLAHGIPDLVAAVVTMLGAGTWLLVVDWRLGLASLVVLVPAVYCLGTAMRRGARSMVEYQTSMAEMNASVVELLRGMPVVKVFNRADDEVRGAEQAVSRYVEVVRRYSLDFLPMGTAFFVLIGANVAVIVPVGVWLWDRGSISTPDLLFFFIVGLGVLAPVVSLLHLFSNLAHIASGGNLVREVLDAAVLDDRAGAGAGTGVGCEPASSAVELRDVTFSYGDRPVLHRVSVLAAPRTVTALVGPSGSGKTTVASLVARFWDVDDGAVLVGGVDVRELPSDVLARHVAVVLQDAFLFDDTIEANLRVARSGATHDELVAACRAARAHDFVMALPDGYATVVGERGARLSGGERQRLTIARAILADAPAIVLDEATAFTDPENEAAIQDALSELTAGKTVLMIAHRLSTIVGADQILVMDAGRIVERGRHDELLAAGGLYARLWTDFEAAESISLGAAVRGGEA